jgi:acyl CoA:acetate/3-ketoacid CoA transferase beta subunit
MDDRELIARRVAQELRDNTLVNLGIGLPTNVARFVPPNLRSIFNRKTVSSALANARPRAWKMCI